MWLLFGSYVDDEDSDNHINISRKISTSCNNDTIATQKKKTTNKLNYTKRRKKPKKENHSCVVLHTFVRFRPDVHAGSVKIEHGAKKKKKREDILFFSLHVFYKQIKSSPTACTVAKMFGGEL